MTLVTNGYDSFIPPPPTSLKGRQELSRKKILPEDKVVSVKIQDLIRNIVPFSGQSQNQESLI